MADTLAAAWGTTQLESLFQILSSFLADRICQKWNAESAQPRPGDASGLQNFEQHDHTAVADKPRAVRQTPESVFTALLHRARERLCLLAVSLAFREAGSSHSMSCKTLQQKGFYSPHVTSSGLDR